jgi:hypothetical protein
MHKYHIKCKLTISYPGQDLSRFRYKHYDIDITIDTDTPFRVGEVVKNGYSETGSTIRKIVHELHSEVSDIYLSNITYETSEKVIDYMILDQLKSHGWYIKEVK